MKISIEIEATPKEARDSLGLPDIQAVQDRVIKRIEEKVMGAVEDYDPSGLLRALVPEGLGVLEGFQKAMFKSFKMAPAVRKPGRKNK